MTVNINLKREPHWLYETISLLTLGFDDDPAYPLSFIDDPAAYRMSRAEIGERLGQTAVYLKAVYTNTRKLVAEYKDVEKYFTSKGYGCTAILASNLDRVEMLSCEEYKAALFRHALLAAVETGTEESDLDYSSDPNVGNLFAALTKTNWTDADKLQIMELFQSAEADFPRMSELMKKVEEVLISRYELIRDKCKSTANDYSGNQSEESENLLSHTIDMFGSMAYKNVNVFLGIVCLNQLTLVVPSIDNSICYIALGLDFVRLNEMKDLGARQEEQLLRRLKALADANKLKIVRLISQRPMYLKELSEALGITAATASHHVGQLMEEQLIRFEIDGRKVYYSVNAAEFENLAASIAEIAERSKASGENEQHS